MSNVTLFKSIIDLGEKSSHLHIITIKKDEYLIDITYDSIREDIKSAVFYTKDMKTCGWLSKEEREELKTGEVLNKLLEVTLDEVHY